MSLNARRGYLTLAGTAALAVPVILGAASGALAQSPPAASATEVEAITVTARKREERLLDVPVAATAFTTQQLQRYATTEITDVGAQIPAVMFDSVPAGSGAALTVRGIGASPLDTSIDSSVEVDVDGVPVTRGRVIQQALIDLSSIDVLKGPQALYYGKNSPAGVISLASENPGKAWNGYLRFGDETVSREVYVEGAAGGPINDVLGLRLAVRSSDMAGGWIHNVAQPIADPFNPGLIQPGAAQSEAPQIKETSGRLTLVYTPSSPFDATLKLLGSHYHDNGEAKTEEISACAPGASHPSVFGVSDPFGDCKLNGVTSTGSLNSSIAAHYPLSNGGKPFSKVDSMLSGLTMNYHAGEITLTSQTGYYFYDEANFDNYDGAVYDQLGGADNEHYESLTQELRASSSFAGPLNFTAGLFYQHEDRHTNTSGAIFGEVPFGVLPDPRNGNTNNYEGTYYDRGNTYSAFGELNWKILPNLELAGGARYTNERKFGDDGYIFVNETFAPVFPVLPEGTRLGGFIAESNISPQATLTWHPQHDVTLYAAFKTGYKSGGFGNPTILPASTTLSDLEFKHESALGGEVGAKAVLFDGRLTGDVTAYLFDYSNLQVTAFNAATTSFFIQNAATARTEGIEGQVSYRATPELNLRAAFAYTHARYLSFPTAECFSGQTLSQGCNAAGAQDLSGKSLERAPDFTGSVGFSFDHAVSDSLMIGLSSDLRYSDGYFLDAADTPYGYQNSFATVDASLRLYKKDQPWELAVIGRNLSNVYYAVAGDSTPGGPPGEYSSVVARARQIYLQATYHFR